jgi:AmmeMemoRadiSam system protein B
MNMEGNVRKPAAAGRFYPAEPTVLNTEIKEMLDSVEKPRLTGRIRALIVPHAGYPYSGPTAAHAYATLAESNYQRVVIIGPSHYGRVDGITFSDADAFRTPNGDMKIDQRFVERLIQSHSALTKQSAPHRHEHSLEVQLPFIQNIMPDQPIVPGVCSHMSLEELRDLAKALSGVAFDHETLWIISTDFTHYGSSFGYVPFRKDIANNLEELDMGAIEKIQNCDLPGFFSYVERTGATICGATPIGLLLALLEQSQDQISGKLLSYATSADITQQFDHSVSYAAMAFSENQ